MTKLIILIVLAVIINAKLINKISIVVNNEPITSYDIQSLKNKISKNITQKEVENILINQAIENTLIKEYSIKINQSEIDGELENGKYNKKEIIRKLSLHKLYKKIVYLNMKKPTDNELQTYYKNNKHLFIMTNTMDTIRYASNNRNDLISILNNPISRNSSVDVKNMSLKLSSLNPKLAILLENTQENNFTPIINFGATFVMIYVSKKYGKSYANFENIKDRLSIMYLKNNEKLIVTNFINKKKREANIKYF